MLDAPDARRHVSTWALVLSAIAAGFGLASAVQSGDRYTGSQARRERYQHEVRHADMSGEMARLRARIEALELATEEAGARVVECCAATALGC